MPSGALNVSRNDYIKNPKEFDIFTPPEICYFIQDVVSINKYEKILDVCCGSGNLSVPFSQSETPPELIGVDVIDHSSTYPGKFMQFDFANIKDKKELAKMSTEDKEEDLKDYLNNCDYLKIFSPQFVLCNPPWNKCPGKKLYPFEIAKKVFELFGPKTPMVLFTPMGLRLNRRYGAKRARELESLIERGCEITSICSMPIDAFFPGNKEKGQQWEILFFNVENIKPHYWFTEKLKEKYSL